PRAPSTSPPLGIAPYLGSAAPFHPPRRTSVTVVIAPSEGSQPVPSTQHDRAGAGRHSSLRGIATRNPHQRVHHRRASRHSSLRGIATLGAAHLRRPAAGRHSSLRGIATWRASCPPLTRRSS